jgi:hypothetical protein
MFAAYLPHPFLVASGLLFAFTWWAFVSARRRAKKVHPKSQHPLRLGIESILLGLAVLAVTLGAPALLDDPSRIDLGYVVVVGSMSLALTAAYFMAPFMGYNLFWDAYMFNQDRAVFLALLSAMLFLFMGIQGQFGL